MRFKSYVAVALLIVMAAPVFAQQRKIYLDPSDDFSAYFSSALQKKKVPVTITTDPKQADFTAQFQAKSKDGSLLKGVLASLGAGTYNNNSVNEVVMTIINAKTKDVEFSYTCRKESQNMDASSSLATSVAECLAKHWKDNLH